MRIHNKNGQTIDYDVSNIDKVTFVEKDNQEQEVNISIEGAWKGIMWRSKIYNGLSYYSTYSILEFAVSPESSTSGTGRWIDYYTNAPWDYVQNHFRWSFNDEYGVIYVHLTEDDTTYQLYHYTLSADRFNGVYSDSGNNINFSLQRCDTPNVNANAIDKSPNASRIEMPHVMNGDNYLFLSKQTADISDGINYSIEWDCMQRAQRWTCWMWDKANSTKGWVRNNWSSGETFNGYGGNGDPFQPDISIPAEYRTELSDYSGSGYNRGHMCASEDRIVSKEVNGQTFYLSNMHPQIGGHNSGIWATLESKVRNWRDAIVNAGGVMYVCKGGTIGDVTLDGKTSSGVIKRISSKSEYDISSTSGMPVPKYFYMALLKKTASGLYSAVGIWTEHKTYSSSEYKDMTTFMITIDELEARTGIDFFCNLPDKLEDAVESTIFTSEWK